MGLFDRFRRRAAISDPAALGAFIDEHSLLISEHCVDDYTRLRAGSDADALFADPAFAAVLDRARWEAYPRALAMVGEVVAADLRPHAAQDPQENAQDMNAHAMLHGLAAVTLEAFDRRAVPAAIGEADWRAARAELARSLNDLSRRRPATVESVAAAHSSYYLAIMPLHAKLGGDDFPALRNQLKAMLAQIEETLAARAQLPALAETLAAIPQDSPPVAPSVAP